MEYLEVLIVDDEPGMATGMKRVLDRTTIALPDVHAEVSFKSRVAESGEQALELMDQSCPDILLLDHKLPGISGLDVLERIAANQQEILTIMITAYASLETAVTAIKRGAYDFLAKPFTPKELTNTIRKASTNLILARQARKLAQEKRRVRFEFISVLAHELKSPLAAVEGYLKIIQDRSAGQQKEVYDKMIDRCSLRLEGMRKMILDLLDLTFIESGQKKRELTEVDVHAMAKQSIETNLPAAQERKVTIQIDAVGSVVMHADSKEIEIILNNLISNAIKYNKQGGQVTASLANDGEYIVIIVADTGIGMKKEDCEKLFQDFVRIKSPQTRYILGSGLGLSIVKKLAYLYDGDVSVQSEPDKGSVFTVRLKQTNEQEPAAATEEKVGSNEH